MYVCRSTAQQQDAATDMQQSGLVHGQAGGRDLQLEAIRGRVVQRTGAPCSASLPANYADTVD